MEAEVGAKQICKREHVSKKGGKWEHRAILEGNKYPPPLATKESLNFLGMSLVL